MTEPLDRLTAALADRYRIERELGAGGMATVYLAHDPRHNRKVAIKVMRPELACRGRPRAFPQGDRNHREPAAPHILPLYDSGEVDGTVFYVMPYVEGEIAAPPARAGDPASRRRRGADRRRDRRRARLRPPPRRDPSRRQAGQRAVPRRARHGGRLRHRDGQDAAARTEPLHHGPASASARRST